MVLGKLDSHIQKMKLDHYLTSYTKINIDLNVKPETIKILEENIGSTLFDTGLSNIFLDMSLQAKEKKAKIKRTTSHSKLLHSKRNHKHNEKTTSKWEKIFANHISNKALISKIYKELIKQQKA